MRLFSEEREKGFEPLLKSEPTHGTPSNYSEDEALMHRNSCNRVLPRSTRHETGKGHVLTLLGLLLLVACGGSSAEPNIADVECTASNDNGWASDDAGYPCRCQLDGDGAYRWSCCPAPGICAAAGLAR